MLVGPRWLLVLLVAAPLGAQRVPVVTLSRAEAELGEPFSEITGVRELRDGRVIVLDSRVRVVGFGKASGYVSRYDQDDLQYLQRYPLPGS